MLQQKFTQGDLLCYNPNPTVLWCSRTNEEWIQTAHSTPQHPLQQPQLAPPRTAHRTPNQLRLTSMCIHYKLGLLKAAKSKLQCSDINLYSSDSLMFA
jgi:hypothetical protein